MSTQKIMVVGPKKFSLSEEKVEWLRNSVIPPLGSPKMMALAKRYHKQFGGKRISAANLHAIATKIQSDAKKAAAKEAKKVAKKAPAKKKVAKKKTAKKPAKKTSSRKGKSRGHDYVPKQERWLKKKKLPRSANNPEMDEIVQEFKIEFELDKVPSANALHIKIARLQGKWKSPSVKKPAKTKAEAKARPKPKVPPCT